MRAAELCQQMLAYAGKGRFVVTNVDFGELINSTVSLLKSSVDKNTNLVLSIDSDPV